MSQSSYGNGASLHSSHGSLSESIYGVNNGLMDDADSIISIYGKLYASSQSSGAESIISGSMPPRKIIAQLSRHGCQDVTNQLDPRSISTGVVSTGGSGDVYRGLLWDGRRVGIKCLRLLVGMDEEGEKQVKARRAARELYIWSKCNHPNIQELLGVALYDNRVAMVSPWMKNGNLSWYISRHPEADRYSLCGQIAAAVAYLSECGVVHGDIKGQNFLISDDHTAKLTDFGSSITNQCSLKFASTASLPHTTLRWTAPEIFLGETQHTYEGDVYALGMTMLETITGAIPWNDMLDVAVIHNLIQKTYPPRPECMPIGDVSSDLLWGLIVRCWASEPQRRPLAVSARDELDAINKQRQRAFYKAKDINMVGIFDTRTPTQIPIATTSKDPQEPKERWLLTAARAFTYDRDVRKQHKLELLEKRRLQEERNRARANAMMAKHEQITMEYSDEWSDPWRVSGEAERGVTIMNRNPPRLGNFHWAE